MIALTLAVLALPQRAAAPVEVLWNATNAMHDFFDKQGENVFEAKSFPRNQQESHKRFVETPVIALPNVPHHSGDRIETIHTEDGDAHVYFSHSYTNLRPSPKLCSLAALGAFADAERIVLQGNKNMSIHFSTASARNKAHHSISVGSILNLHKFHGKVERSVHSAAQLFTVIKIAQKSVLSPETLELQVCEAAIADAFADGGSLSLQFHSVSQEFGEQGKIQQASGLSSNDSLVGDLGSVDATAEDSSASSQSSPKGKEKEELAETQKERDGKDDDPQPPSGPADARISNTARYKRFIVEATKNEDGFGPAFHNTHSTDGVAPVVVTYEDSVAITWRPVVNQENSESDASAVLMLCYGIFNPFYYADDPGHLPSFPPSCSIASGVFPLRSDTTDFAFPAPHSAHGLPHGYYYFQLVEALSGNAASYENAVLGVSNPLLYIHSPFYTSGVVDETEPAAEEKITFRAVSVQTPLRYDPVLPGQKISVDWTYQPGADVRSSEATLHLCLADVASYAPEYRQFTQAPGVIESASSYVSSFARAATQLPGDIEAGESYFSMPLPVADGDGTATFAVPDDIPSGVYFIEARAVHSVETDSDDEKVAEDNSNTFLSRWMPGFLWKQEAVQQEGAPASYFAVDDGEVVAESTETSTFRHDSPLHIFNSAIPNNQIRILQPKLVERANGGGHIAVSWDIGEKVAVDSRGNKQRDRNSKNYAILSVYQDVPAFPIPGFTGSAADQPRITPKPVCLYEKLIAIDSLNEFSIDLADIDINRWIDGVSTLSRAFSYPIKGPVVRSNATRGAAIRQQASFFGLLRKSLYWTQIREMLRILPFPFYVEIRYDCPDPITVNRQITEAMRSSCRGVAESQRFSIDDPFGTLTVPLDGIHFGVECGANGTHSVRESRSGREIKTPIEKFVSPLCALTDNGRMTIATKQAGGASDEKEQSASDGPSLDVRYAPSYLYLDTTTKRTQFHVDMELRMRTPLYVHSNIPFNFEGHWNRADALPAAKPHSAGSPVRSVVPIEQRTLLGPLRVEIFGVLFSLEAKLTPACAVAISVPEAFTALSLSPALNFGVTADYRNFVSNEEIASFESRPEDERPEHPPQSGLTYSFSVDANSVNVPQRVQLPLPGDRKEIARFSGDVQLFSGKANVTLTFSPEITLETSLYAFAARPAVQTALVAIGAHPPIAPYSRQQEDLSVLIPSLSTCDHCEAWHSAEFRVSYTLCPFTLYSSHSMSITALTSAALSYFMENSAAGQALRRRWSILRGRPVGEIERIGENPPLRSAQGMEAFGYDYFCPPEDGDSAVTVIAGCAPYDPAAFIANVEVDGLLEAIVASIPLQTVFSNKKAAAAVCEETLQNSEKLSQVEFTRKLRSLRYSVEDLNHILSNICTAVAGNRAEVKMLLTAMPRGQSSAHSETAQEYPREEVSFGAAKPCLSDSLENLLMPTRIRLAVFLWEKESSEAILQWMRARAEPTLLSLIETQSLEPIIPYYTAASIEDVLGLLNIRRQWQASDPKAQLSLGQDAQLECAQFVDFLAPFPALLQDLLGPSKANVKREWIAPDGTERTAEEKFYFDEVFLHPGLALLDVLRSDSGQTAEAEAESVLRLPHPTSVSVPHEEIQALPVEEAPSLLDTLRERFAQFRSSVEPRDVYMFIAVVIFAPLLYWLFIVEIPVFIL